MKLRSAFLVASVPGFVLACSGADSHRSTLLPDGGTAAGGSAGRGGSGGGGTGGSGGNGAAGAGGSGGNGTGGADAGSGGSSMGGSDAGSGGAPNAGGTSNTDAGTGGTPGSGGTPNTDAGAGGVSSAGGTGNGDASVDAGICPVDGVSCGGGSVCCGGQCVTGSCCTPSDCHGADGGTGAGFLCSNHVCENVAGNLSGLLWQLPCLSDASAVVCNTASSPVTVSTSLGGATGVHYDVTLHFTGIVEQKTYTGGCANGFLQTAGVGAGDTYNVYRLEVSSPHQVFYLNRGTSQITNSFVIDYQQTIVMNAGATVTLFADAVDAQEIRPVDAASGVLSVSGTSVPQPYDGQFIEMKVVSVVPDAVSGFQAASPGSAMSFAGAQVLTIADAASLQVSDTTLESWFSFSTTPGVYATILGKPYQGGSTDSYTLWYQGGVLNAGLGLGSPSGAAAVSWTPVFSEWHHVATTFDAAQHQQTLFIDGLPVSCVTANAPSYDTHALLIGGDVDNGSPNGFWYGTLDEVRVFSAARTPTQVWADMHTRQLGPTTGLVGEWTFDEGSGQTAADSSGTGNGAVLGATASAEASDPVWVTSTVPR